MTRITQTDQILLLLRSHLERSARARKSGRPDDSARGKTAGRPPLERVRDIAASSPLEDSDIQRVLLSGLLEQEFGSALVNDPNFQDIVERVRATILQDPSSRQLLEQAVKQLLDGPASA